MARTHGHGNPRWSREETILALDLYFDSGGVLPSSSDPRVRELSALLQRLAPYPPESRKETFRNPAGVVFKLQNLRQVATGEGLGNVSATDRAVWAALGSQMTKTKKIALSIRNATAMLAPLKGPAIEEDEEFFEGRLLTTLHRRIERNPNVRKKLLAARRKRGHLECDMCSTESPCQGSYAEDAIFEAHHLLSMATVGERQTRIKDLALLCANCHRVLHRLIVHSRRWLSVEDASAMLTALQ